MKNHYQTLGVNPSATAEEIKDAYKRLSKKVHPDKNWGDKIFEELFKNVNEAYQVLGNETERRVYNQKYNHFFFSHAQHTSAPQPRAEQAASFQPRKISLLRKFFINGLGSLLLVFFFMGVNAFVFTNDEIQSANEQEEVLENITTTARGKAPQKAALNKNEEIKQEEIVIPVSKQEDESNITALLKEEKHEVEATAKVETSTNELEEEKFDKEAKVIKKATVKMQWTEKDMMDVVEKVKELKIKTGNKTSCIRLLQSSNSNIKNGFTLANYLQLNNFSIAGRLSTSKTSKGVLMEVNTNNCIVITIGFI